MGPPPFAEYDQFFHEILAFFFTIFLFKVIRKKCSFGRFYLGYNNTNARGQPLACFFAKILICTRFVINFSKIWAYWLKCFTKV